MLLHLLINGKRRVFAFEMQEEKFERPPKASTKCPCGPSKIVGVTCHLLAEECVARLAFL
jgi:hypothetical protein